METSAQRALLLFEKLISTETFLLVLASILFTDMYLMLCYNTNVFVLNIPVREIDVTLGQIVAFVLAYSAFFGIVAPLCAALIDKANTWQSSSKYKPSQYISLEKLKQDALKEQNPFMYKHYENTVIRLEKSANIRRLCIAIVLCSLMSICIALFRANGIADGNLLKLAAGILSEDGAVPYLLRIPALCASLVVFFVAVNPTADIDNSEYLPAYALRPSKEWIEEIKVGLIDKDVMLSHLRSVVEDAFQGEKYDSSNKAHKFCVKHGLVNHQEGKLVISVKGEFFNRFIDNQS